MNNPDSPGRELRSFETGGTGRSVTPSEAMVMWRQAERCELTEGAAESGCKGLEKHGRGVEGVEQAWRMLDIFASFGVRTFDLTQTDIDGHKQGFRPSQTLEQIQRSIPYLIESAAKRQHNVIVRPQGAAAALVQLDDLSVAALNGVRTVAFLILTTSPGNHQAWVAVRDGAPDFARRLRQGSGADPSASGATRVAGARNFKRKYEPDFPIVSILEATPKRSVMRAELEALGLVAAADPRPALSSSRYFPQSRPLRKWPSYERCLENAPPAHHSNRPDVSRADFTFCLLAIDWGWGLEDTVQHLMEKSSKARENGEAYARLTAQRAAAAVERRREVRSGKCRDVLGNFHL